jgi:hypothetical protein
MPRLGDLGLSAEKVIDRLFSQVPASSLVGEENLLLLLVDGLGVVAHYRKTKLLEFGVSGPNRRLVAGGRQGRQALTAPHGQSYHFLDRSVFHYICCPV